MPVDIDLEEVGRERRLQGDGEREGRSEGGKGGRGRLTAAISVTSKARCWLKYVFWFWGFSVVGGRVVPFWRVVEVDIVGSKVDRGFARELG